MSGKSRFPFTPLQWQELEHQALIFKYMVSGIPIPPDLLFSIKRSSFDSPDGVWSYSPMGMRKIDPEPGRCRRTDGKKWRCSKEAYPDSKYCERHMHRGKNRSRKPVEVFKSTTPALNSTPLTPAISSLSKISPPLSSISHSLSPYSSNLLHPSYHLSPSSRPSASPLLDSGFYSHADHRYFHGMKEEVDEHPFFSEAPTGAIRDFSASGLDEYWQPRHSTMSCSSSSPKDSCSFSLLQSDYSSLQLRSLDNSTKSNKDDRSIALGKREMSIPTEREPPQKTVHRFFDEWPPRDREAWLDLDGKSSNSGLITSSKLFPHHP